MNLDDYLNEVDSKKIKEIDEDYDAIMGDTMYAFYNLLHTSPENLKRAQEIYDRRMSKKFTKLEENHVLHFNDIKNNFMKEIEELL